MASETRAHIVDSARELFWQHGFEATSIAQISERSGAMTGSIYYFFKTKASILEAVLDHYDEQLGVWLIDPVFERTDDPVERIFGVIDTYRDFLVETHFAFGCPVGGLAIEVPEDLGKARAKIAKIFAALVGALEACTEALADRLPPDAPSPAAIASLAMTVIEGGIVQARATRGIEPFDRSVECLRDYLDRMLTEDRR